MRILGLLAYSLVAIVMASCVHSNESQGGEKATLIDVNLSTKGNDIAFDVKSLQVPFGHKVTLKFKNQATADSEILHNIAVLKPGTTDDVIAYFEETDYDPEKISKYKNVLAITPTLEPGKDSTLVLTKKMLTKKGFYPYVCLVPGHADMLGMKGLLHVK